MYQSYHPCITWYIQNIYYTKLWSVDWYPFSNLVNEEITIVSEYLIGVINVYQCSDTSLVINSM